MGFIQKLHESEVQFPIFILIYLSLKQMTTISVNMFSMGIVVEKVHKVGSHFLVVGEK